jgi:hypothetical protein
MRLTSRLLLPLSAFALIGALGLAPAIADEDTGCHRYDMEVFCSGSSRIVLVGDPFEATATVKNTGDVMLSNVVLVLRGGEGVKQVGDAPLSIKIPKLDPGQTQEVKGTFVSHTVGEGRIDASAREERGWAAAGCFCGILLKGLPAIQLEMIDLDSERQKKGIFEMGETFLYELTVENDVGTALTPDLKIVWSLPKELEFVSGTGDRGATVTGTGQTAESSSFVLAPNQVLKFELTVRVIGVPERNLVQSRASVTLAAGNAELATETESTTLKAAAGK